MSTPVYISIYDMYTMNNYIAMIGVGIYHTGIEIFGKEFGYGGHPFPFSGIFEMQPRDTEELGETFRFKESIEIGRTDFSPSEVEQIIAMLGRDFRGIDYHLMNKNCNHFTEKLCKTLCGVEIPAWINRLAYLTTFVPFVEKMIPREWISPIAIQNTVDTHINNSNESASNGSDITETPNVIFVNSRNATSSGTRHNDSQERNRII